MLRVVIADDHRIMQQGLVALLTNSDDIEVVGTATDGQQAIALVRRMKPDVLVMDLAMPELNGLEALDILRARGLNTPVVVLSMYDNPDFVNLALEKGASAYVLKGAAVEDLVTAVHAVSRGDTFLSAKLS